MAKIDEKDRKILVELDQDARQSDSKIAKKLKTNKQVINYRIQKLQEKGIITNFYTLINTGKLGLNSHYVFLQLKKINSHKENEFLEKLNSLFYTGWVVSGTGRWDIILLVYAVNFENFDELLNEIIEICGEHLHEYNFTTLIYSEHISYKFLSKKSKIVKLTEKQKEIKLDEKDKSILSRISQDARKNIVDISSETKLPPYVISYHLKRLIKEKLIEGFKPKIDISKLNLQWYLLLIKLQRNNKDIIKFMNFCKNHDKIYYLTNTIGLYNVMIDLHVKDIEEFKEVLFELKENFPDLIEVYESFIVFKENKINYFPERLLN